MAIEFGTGLNRFAGVGYNVSTSGVRSAGIPARTTLGSQQGGGDMDVRGIGSVPGITPIRPAAQPPVTQNAGVAKPQFPAG